MASWAAILALSDFHYSAVTGVMTFRATREKSRIFWSTGYAWGTLEQTPGESATQAELKVLGGSLKLRRFVLTGLGSTEEASSGEMKAGEYRRLLVEKTKS
jgi:non-lysosomal glucosylceramidase